MPKKITPKRKAAKRKQLQKVKTTPASEIIIKTKFSKPITLDNIKKNKDLSHLALIKQSRLSVMPIDSKSWKILNNMSKI